MDAANTQSRQHVGAPVHGKVGKRLHLRHLSPDCLELLSKAKSMVEVNTHEDSHYHIADSKLG